MEGTSKNVQYLFFVKSFWCKYFSAAHPGYPLDDCPAQKTFKTNPRLIVIVSSLLTVSILVNLIAFLAILSRRLKNCRKKGNRSFEHCALCKILLGTFYMPFLSLYVSFVRYSTSGAWCRFYFISVLFYFVSYSLGGGSGRRRGYINSP